MLRLGLRPPESDVPVAVEYMLEQGHSTLICALDPGAVMHITGLSRCGNKEQEGNLKLSYAAEQSRSTVCPACKAHA